MFHRTEDTIEDLREEVRQWSEVWALEAAARERFERECRRLLELSQDLYRRIDELERSIRELPPIVSQRMLTEVQK